MFDAVSAHTDCLIQIVKERHACRVGEAHSTLLTSKVKWLVSLLFRRRLYKGAGSSGWRVPPCWEGRIIGGRAGMTRAFCKNAFVCRKSRLKPLKPRYKPLFTPI